MSRKQCGMHILFGYIFECILIWKELFAEVKLIIILLEICNYKIRQLILKITPKQLISGKLISYIYNIKDEYGEQYFLIPYFFHPFFLVCLVLLLIFVMCAPLLIFFLLFVFTSPFVLNLLHFKTDQMGPNYLLTTCWKFINKELLCCISFTV